MAVGIIAEYNPFHNGHRYMLTQIKKTYREGIIICMSGSTTQRGELALLNKWQRAQIAVQNGADLVIELPTAFACRSAQDFARGGVRLLNALGVTDTLAFGTEHPDLALLQSAAAFQPESYPGELQQKLKAGHSYGSALSQLISEKLHIPSEMLREPNTILAVEYLRAIQKYSPLLTPLPILRRGAGHNAAAPAGSFASGTAIRKLVYDGSSEAAAGLVPDDLLAELRHTSCYPSDESLYRLIRWQLLTLSPAGISRICGVNEGLEYKLHQSVKCPSLPALLQTAATRRYPATRIRRLLLHLLLNFTQETADAMDAAGPLYIRVLAFNAEGRRLLRDIQQKGRLPVITKPAAFLNRLTLRQPDTFTPLQQMLYLDISAANLRELCCAPLAPSLEKEAATPQLYADLTVSPLYIP